jgi:hypothetical protein
MRTRRCSHLMFQALTAIPTILGHSLRFRLTYMNPCIVPCSGIFPIASGRILVMDKCLSNRKAAQRLGMKEDRRGAKEFPVLFICRGAAKMMHASRLQVGRAAELRPRGHKVVNTLVRRDRSHRSLREKEHLDLVTSSLCSYLAPDGTSLEFAQFRKPSVLTRRQAAWVRRSRISRQTLSD